MLKIVSVRRNEIQITLMYHKMCIRDRVREIAAKEGSVVVPVCAAVEADIAELDDEERDEFMQELGLEEPGLNLSLIHI